jgi:DNA mismatch repair protein MutL
VASQIAAGEVVERPVSVVKELIENSIDAGASNIAITSIDAGRTMIEVADDGYGIPSGELNLAVSRHATSKLVTADDLYNIKTLGFRGEALASIASISRFTITSRQKEEDIGARITVEGGIANQVQSVGGPQGTLVQVENLFFNVPARLKFLKTDRTERRRIDGFVTRYALAYPDIRFMLKQEGRVSIQTSGNNNQRDTLASLYGAEIARQMLDINTIYEDYRITGFISPTNLTRSNRQEITIFVNGRWVQDIGLSTALVRAYHTMLMVGRYPIAMIFLDMPPEYIDVNVHPAKTEVRFRSQKEVFGVVQRTVRLGLLAYTPVPELNAQAMWTEKTKLDKAAYITKNAWTTTLSSYQEASTDTGMDIETPRQDFLPQSGSPILRLIGQVGASYLVAEGPDGLYLIDQHAAHERVLFERFMSQKGNDLASQSLLDPVVIELTPEGTRLLSDQLPVMEMIGFKIEKFGINTFIVRGIPSIVIGSDPAAAIRSVVEDIEEDETPLKGEIEARIIARVCKQAAVKAGQILTSEEQRVLLSDLERCENPRTCPHGRPTMIHLSIELVERQFGRKGAL